MKTITICLFLGISLRFAATAQPIDVPTLEKISGCLLQCQVYSMTQPYTPLPDSLSDCLRSSIQLLRGQKEMRLFGTYTRGVFIYANHLSNEGEFRKAIEEFRFVESALQGMDTASMMIKMNAAHTHNMLALCYAQVFDLDNANLYIEKAINGYRALNLREDLYNAYINKAAILSTQGNSGAALSLAETALQLWGEIETRIPADRKINKLGAENQKYIALFDLADSLSMEAGTRVVLPLYREILDGLRKALAQVAPYEKLTQDAKVATTALVVRIQSCYVKLRAAEPAWADSILYYHRFMTGKGIDSTSAKLYYGLEQSLVALAFGTKNRWEEAFKLSVAACRQYNYPIRHIFDKDTPLGLSTIEQKHHLIQVLRLQATMLRFRPNDPKALKHTLFIYDNIFRLLDDLRLNFLSESNMEFASERFIPLFHEAASAALELHDRNRGSETKVLGIMTSPKVLGMTKEKEVDYFEKALQYTEMGNSFTLRNTLRRRVENDSLFAEERTRQARLRDAELRYRNKTVPLDTLEQAYRTVKEWRELVKKENPRYFHEQIDQEVVSLNWIQRELVDDSTAIIELAPAGDSVYLFVIAPKSVFSLKIVTPPDWMQIIDRYTESITSAQENMDFKSSGYQIYEALLKKLLENKLPDTVKRLILIPNGKLQQLIFESLPTRPVNDNVYFGDIPYLVQRYTVVYGYSLTSFKYATLVKRTAPHFSLGAFIGKYGNEPESALRCAGTPLDNLSGAAVNIVDMVKTAQFDGNIFDAATEAQFKKYCYEFDILLFAMHGCLDTRNYLESGVLFTLDPDEEDDRLTVREVMGSPDNLNARLAIFGSCETGRGLHIGGEGIISLAYAFAYAGVPTSVAAIGPIEQKETAGLLESFCKYLLQGKSKDWALATAKTDFIKNNPKKHPYYWAKLILIGDPSALK